MPHPWGFCHNELPASKYSTAQMELQLSFFLCQTNSKTRFEQYDAVREAMVHLYQPALWKNHLQYCKILRYITNLTALICN